MIFNFFVPSDILKEKKGKEKNMKKTIPIWEKIMLTVEEASEYSNIGINRLQAMLNKPGCTFVFFVGKGKRLVKRKEFEKYLEKTREI